MVLVEHFRERTERAQAGARLPDTSMQFLKERGALGSYSLHGSKFATVLQCPVENLFVVFW